MSIWCSWPSVGYDDWHEEGEEDPRGGHVLTYAAGFSNHYPDLRGIEEKPAHVGISHIAPWCVTGHDQHRADYRCTGCGDDHEAGEEGQVGPWVRLSTYAEDNDDRNGDRVSASVVLDEGAARALVADLTAWLARPKVHPTAANAGGDETDEREGVRGGEAGEMASDAQNRPLSDEQPESEHGQGRR